MVYRGVYQVDFHMDGTDVTNIGGSMVIEPMDLEDFPEFTLGASPPQDPEHLPFGDFPPPQQPSRRVSEALGQERIEVRKKGNKRWKRECEDLDMIWLESRKEGILLDVPEHVFGELKVYATHKSSQSLVEHADASTMLKEKACENGRDNGWVTVSLKNERDKNQFKVSTSKSNGRDPILCVIVSVKDGAVVAMSPVLAIYRHETISSRLDQEVCRAFRVLLEEARKSPETVLAPKVTADSVRLCWKDMCDGRDDADVREHLCYNDLRLVMKRRQNVWIGHDDGREWAERGLWDPFQDYNSQLVKVGEAVAPTAEERKDDDPRTVYCLPYLDMRHSKILWYCWTEFEGAKRFFLSLRSRAPSNPKRKTWMVSTHDLLENEARPPMLLKLTLEKAPKESAPSK